MQLRSLLRRGSIQFQFGNRFLQPMGQSFIDFLFCRPLIQMQECVAVGCQRNVPARNFFAALICGHKLHQQTIAAWCWILLAVAIHAGGRVLERQFCPPWVPLYQRWHTRRTFLTNSNSAFRTSMVLRLSLGIVLTPLLSCVLCSMKVCRNVTAITDLRDAHHGH